MDLDVDYYRKLRCGKLDPILARKDPAQLMVLLQRVGLSQSKENNDNNNNTITVDDANLIKFCVSTLASVTRMVFEKNEIEAQCKLMDFGICESLVEILAKFGASVEDIAMYSCEVIRNLAWGSGDFRDVMMECGVAQVLMETCKAHVGEPSITVYGVTSLALLVASNDGQYAKNLSQSGAMEVLGLMGNFGLNFRHEFSEEVVFGVTFAVKRMCFHEHAHFVEDAGLCELIIMYLRVYTDHPVIRAAILDCLCSVSSLGFQCRERLAKNDTCSIIHQLLHTSLLKVDLWDLTIEEQKFCVQIIMNFSYNANIVDIFSASDKLIGNLLEVLDIQLEDYQTVEMCLMAIRNLCIYGRYAYESRMLIADSATACVIFDRLRRSPDMSYEIRNLAKQLLKWTSLTKDHIREWSNSTLEGGSYFRCLVNASAVKPGIIPLLAEMTIHQQKPKLKYQSLLPLTTFYDSLNSHSHSHSSLIRSDNNGNDSSSSDMGSATTSFEQLYNNDGSSTQKLNSSATKLNMGGFNVDYISI